MRVKYPHTMHFSFSPGLKNDDRVITTLNGFVGHEIVVTEKMDGECTTLYNDHIHARSLDSKHHESRDWVKSFHGQISYKIPDGWRVCGENVYAQHSVTYDDLESYFYGFSIWDENNVAQGWDDTLLWFDDLDITPVPQVYRGRFDLKLLIEMACDIDIEKHEGFVVRVTDPIPYDEFETRVVKWVRPGHVQTDEHWMHKKVIPNKLKVKVWGFR